LRHPIEKKQKSPPAAVFLKPAPNKPLEADLYLDSINKKLHDK
jgi:hypothetical protein